MEKQIHGGNIYDKEVSLDFSVNINPLGMPDGVQDAILNNISGYETYPDIRYTALREAVAGKERVQAERILCGNGASELIMAVVRAEKPYKCAVAAPSFSGYERAVSAYGAETEYYKLDEKNGFGYADACSQLKDMDIQMCFICNPNNPTGNLIPEDILVNILDICRDRNIVVVADECFLRFNPQYEIISCKRFLDDYDNLVIINAFTKFYAMAGIRLGYMMSANTELINRVSLQLPEWNMSSVAQRAGIAAFADKDYEKYTHELIQRERQFLFNELSDMKCIVYPSQADYLTFRLPQSKAGCMIQEELLKHGILIRSCGSYHNMPADCYRIAVKQHADNEVLINNMRQILEV